MARCPACSRRVGIGDVIRQTSIHNYRCARCGRNWTFTRGTIATASVLALMPLIYAAIRPHDGFVASACIFAGAIIASAALYALSLSAFGRLQPIRSRRH